MPLRNDRHSDAVWGGIVVLVFGVEIAGIRRLTAVAPLSRVVARIFKTDTAAGKISFGCAWGLLTWWFLPHVWSYVVNEEDVDGHANDIRARSNTWTAAQR